MRISVLDQSPISEGSSGPEALQNTLVEVAQLMLPHYSAFKVAETFSLLAGLYPGLRHLAQALPGLPEKPEVWLLGSSHQSAIWAEEWGLPYAFADFINRVEPPHGVLDAQAGPPDSGAARRRSYELIAEAMRA